MLDSYWIDMVARRYAHIAAIAALLLSGCMSSGNRAPERPNILLIVADDLGYADLGSFGSDIRTPNIDALADRGVRFTHFHTAPFCAPTRSMLLTGNNNHVAGMGVQGSRPGIPGYEGYLSDRVAPLPRILRDAGYHTYSVGKWHLGTDPEHRPAAAGFERSFNLLHGAGSHYSAIGFYEGGSKYSENGQDAEWPEGGYSTEVFTDRLIGMIESGLAESDDRPFFGYAAYTSPHWPLQVPEEDLDLYAGRYDDGYDALRERNFESLKSAGIIPEDSGLPPRNPHITPWEELTPEEQRIESREMELYAAMVENLDRHIGRLLAFLEEAGELDNTLIVFMSDNGAAGEDFYYDESRSFAAYLQPRYDNSYENMGRPTSWVSYGPRWAEAGSAPYQLYKGHTTQGGIVAPMIVAGPGVDRRGEIHQSYTTVMDVAPTLIEAAGATYPTGGSIRPMLGESMRPVLTGAAVAVHGPDYVTTLNHRSMSFLRRGEWKLVSMTDPTDMSTFALYNVARDPGETTDLRETHPHVFAELAAVWQDEIDRLEIVLLAPDKTAPVE